MKTTFQPIHFDLDINSFSLYLNSVGGHSLFIEISPQYLIKSSNENEINFYSLTHNNFKFNYYPKFLGIISQGTEQFQIIENYVFQCKIFFKNFILKMNIKSEDINIENDIKFNSIFETFIQENFQNIQINTSFNKLEKRLVNYYKNSRNKLKWILFSFVKWNNSFLNNNFIIMKNLTFNMINPAILDIKLGTSPKISKENNLIKNYDGAHKEIGCRIMGIQKGNVFKHRYNTKNYSLNEFKEEISLFFKNNHELINNTIDEALNIISEIIIKFKFNIKFSSLLLCYDESNKYNKVYANLIDFTFVGEDSKSNNNINKDLISSIKNFVFILNEFQTK